MNATSAETDFARLKAAFEAGKVAKPAFIAEAGALHQVLWRYSDALSGTGVDSIRIDEQGPSFRVGAGGTSTAWLRVPRGDYRVAPLEMLNFGPYEPVEWRLLNACAASARQILDIGANIGYYSTLLALTHSQAHIHAFEPTPSSFAYLERNITENGLSARVTPSPLAISDRIGTGKIWEAPTHGTNASLANVAERSDANATAISLTTLDAWSTEHSIAPDLIKCDVEGAELLVFRGGQTTIRNSLPIVFTELLRKWSKAFGYHPNEVVEFFFSLGYQCFAIGEERTSPISVIDDATLETNFVFLHRDKHAAEATSLFA
ncbi:MAG TPA: hypothetical protein DDY88_06880 [Actinobacteria bacterium]|nr:hypothetical protein [Actinomycetota bacterium]